MSYYSRQLADPDLRVRRVSSSEGSSHIEPPLSDDWPDLKKLRWNAAVIELDYGFTMVISEHSSDYWDRSKYAILNYPPVVGKGSVLQDYYDTWSTMVAYARGVEMYKDQMEARGVHPAMPAPRSHIEGHIYNPARFSCSCGKWIAPLGTSGAREFDNHIKEIQNG